MSDNTESSRERLVDDLAVVLGEAEEMLKRAAAETGDKARDLRSQVETKLLRAKLRLQELEGQAVDHAKAAARATDDYVHAHPWPAIGIATLGNTLGGLSSYAIGRLIARTKPLRHVARVRHYGAPILLFAWLPLAGDALCVAAGWLKLNWIAVSGWQAAGRFLRYWLVAHGTVL